ncbi:MAG: hypothetical protein Q9226_007663, partial [Calogaya cf. arnoldii]
MTVKIIDRPTGAANEESKYPTITGFKPVASYNWLDVPNPTILVPGELPHLHLPDPSPDIEVSATNTWHSNQGYPPIWSPPTHPPTITPDDSSFRYVDQNADRYPKCPINPLFSSVQHVQPDYPFSTIDIVSDRSPLHKLYAFAAGEPNLKDFRFGVNVFGYETNRGGKDGEGKKTVVFHRMEKTTREEYDEGQFHGYRGGFEEQYLCHKDMAEGGTSHYRISEYEFGGLKFLLRYGVDGSISDDKTEGPVITSLSAESPRLDDEKSRNDGNNDDSIEKRKTEESKTKDPTDLNNRNESLSIIPTSHRTMTAQSTLFQLMTRSRYSKTPFDIATKLPDLYLSQTPKFIEAYHHSAGYRKFLREKTPGRFAEADIHVRNIQEELKDWEHANGEVLRR